MRKELPKFFEQILNITEPWYIEKIEQQGNTINIYVDFKKGAKFEYNGKYYSAYDTVQRSWRHLNLFQYETYIHARVPRIKTDDGTKTVEVPWARKNSGFTLLFEAFILELYNHMTVAEIAKKYNTTQNRLWRILDFYVSKELEKQDFSKEPIKTLSVDEIARKKHHVYLTNFLDVEREKVVHIADGKDAETFLSFKERYTEKNGDPKDIESICMDMSVPFKAGAREHFPKAKIIFDKFHVLNVLSVQLDKVRARENKGYHEILKRTKYLLLKNPNNLTKKDKVRLDELMEYQHLDTVQAYGLVLEFKKMFDYKKPSYAAKYFKRWYEKVMKSNIPEMIKAANTLLNHIEGILLHIKTNISNGKIEGMNSKLRGFTKRAFGFKTLKNLKITIFIALGKLNLTPA
jgi:transposase